MSDVPHLLHTVLDAREVRREAEFWREVLGLVYRPGDEAPTGRDDADWLVLTRPDGRRCLAIQEVESLPESRWPEPGQPSVSHLDTTVPTRAALDEAHDRVLSLGGDLRLDRTDDPDEPLRAYASPAGHVFCIFVAPPSPGAARRTLSGTCAFRLMPTDELAPARSTLVVDEVAAGRATLLTYTWWHAADGEQTGTLVLGVPAAEGAVTASWVDSWHQPDVVLLTGTGNVTSSTVDRRLRLRARLAVGGGGHGARLVGRDGHAQRRARGTGRTGGAVRRDAGALDLSSTPGRGLTPAC